MLIIQSFKVHNWLGHKSFKSRIFNTCKWPRWAKNKTFIQNFCLKINWLNQLIMKLACLMQHRRKYEAKIVMKVRVPKLKNVNSTMFGSWEFLWLTYDSSSNIMYCDIRRKTGPNIAGKTKFVTGKNKFKRESFVYHNKSLKHDFFLNMVSPFLNRASSVSFTGLLIMYK